LRVRLTRCPACSFFSVNRCLGGFCGISNAFTRPYPKTPHARTTRARCLLPPACRGLREKDSEPLSGYGRCLSHGSDARQPAGVAVRRNFPWINTCAVASSAPTTTTLRTTGLFAWFRWHEHYTARRLLLLSAVPRRGASAIMHVPRWTRATGVCVLRTCALVEQVGDAAFWRAL